MLLVSLGCQSAKQARDATVATLAGMPATGKSNTLSVARWETVPNLDVNQTAVAKAKPEANNVGLVGFQQDPETDVDQLIAPGALPAGNANEFNDENPLIIPATENSARPQVGIVAAGELTLGQVLQSVQNSYPEIEIAIGELETASGKVLASYGEFDTTFAAHSISQPLGFYQTYRNGTGVTQPLYGGGEVYGTYRIGDGNFEPWYGERETNEGGELKAGFSLPFLKDRNIDARRAALLNAGNDRERLGADVESRLLMFQRAATQAYWDWVASGVAVRVQQQLLDLARQRIDSIEARVEAEDLARIARLDNNRFIAKRKNDLIKAQRSLVKAAIKLSLFYRDASGQPLIPDESQLPGDFPDTAPINPEVQQVDIVGALNRRPEIAELQGQRKIACVDLQYAQNLTLPKLDMKGFAGQDLGGQTSSKGDKTPFELQLGVYAEVPLQRREGLGKIQAAEGKLAQIDAKLQMTRDKIRAEIQDAASAVNAAWEQIRQSRENVELARQSLAIARDELFEAGDIDLIELNIYETSVADAELQLLDAQFKYFYYLGAYQVAIRANAF